MPRSRPRSAFISSGTPSPSHGTNRGQNPVGDAKLIDLSDGGATSRSDVRSAVGLRDGSKSVRGCYESAVNVVFLATSLLQF
jgi:hypothetical protein